jgi:hypothetical protein
MKIESIRTVITSAWLVEALVGRVAFAAEMRIA